MRSIYIPKSIIAKRQRAFISACLIAVITLTSGGALLLSHPASATSTYTWEGDFSGGTTANTEGDDAVTLGTTSSITDTTEADFNAGTQLPGSLYPYAVTNTDGGEIALSEVIIDSATLSSSSVPTLSGDHVYHAHVENNYLYVSTENDTEQGGLTIIDTRGTNDLGDDTLVRRIGGGDGGPAAIYHSLATEDALYIAAGAGVGGSRLIVLDANGTPDPSDDFQVARYDFTTSPGTSGGTIRHVSKSNNLLYITEYMLTVIDTQGTLDPGDDTLHAAYDGGTTPSIGYGTYFNSYILGDHIYISASNGLYVIDTQGTPTQSDDTVPRIYEPGIVVYNVFESNDTLYISTYEGLKMYDTQSTSDPSDDSLMAVFNDSSNPALGNSTVTHTFIQDGRLYVSTSGGGLDVIDMQGNSDPSDDTVIISYTQSTLPSIASNASEFATIANNQLYVSTPLGLSIINLDQDIAYNPSASYLSNPRSLPDTPSVSLSRVANATSDHTVSLAYRYSNTEIFRDDMDTGDNYRGDFYEYGAFFQSTSTANGIFTASNPSASYGGYFWLDTGFPENHFSGDSEVSVRLRLNNQGLGDLETYVFVDDYEGSEDYTDVNNEWVTITFTPNATFSRIGFEVLCVDRNCTFDPSQSIEIDWIQIQKPPTWSSWSTPCTNSVCPIIQADIEDATSIQYRLDLATNDTSTTPIVYSVSFNGAYATSGTYTSTTETFDQTETLGTFVVDDSTPAGTSISYEYTIDGGASWAPVTPGTRINEQASSFAWRATLSTTDTSFTPSITRVTLSLGSEKKGSGTSIERRIQILEAQGETDKALRLRTLWEEKMRSGTPVTEEDLVPFLEELVSLLEQLLAVKRGGG